MYISPIINSSYANHIKFTSSPHHKGEIIDLNKENEIEETSSEPPVKDKSYRNFEIKMGIALLASAIGAGYLLTKVSENKDIQKTMEELEENFSITSKDTTPQLTPNNEIDTPKVILFDKDGTSAIQEIKDNMLWFLD